MGVKLDRPKGAPMDVSELEYCSALRQTDTSTDLRTNGSLSVEDVQLHILSRHGVQASLETIEQEILIDLAGGREYMVEKIVTEEQEIKSEAFFMGECPRWDLCPHETERRVTPLDLVQQVALLMIPELKKLSLASVEWDDDNDDDDDSTDDENQDASIPSAAIPDTEAMLVASQGGTTAAVRDKKPLNNLCCGDSLASNESIDLDDVVASNSLHVDLQGEEVIAPISSSAMVPSKTKTTLRTTAKTTTGKVSFSPDPPRQRRPAYRQTTLHKWATSLRITDLELTPLPTADLTVIDTALLVILEASGLVYGVQLTVDVIQHMLLSFGEDFWPQEIIEQMLVQASGGGSATAVKLDRKTFLTALTADLDLYDERGEERITTHFTDVNADFKDKKKVVAVPVEATRTPRTPVLERIFTASSIDYTVDTYASFTWAVLVWLAVGTVFFTYMFNSLNTTFVQLSCTDTFGCQVAKAIVLWLEIMLKLCIIGGSFVSLATLGNSVFLVGSKKLMGALAILVSIAVVVPPTILAYKVGGIATPFFDTENLDDEDPLYIITMIIGCILVFLQVVQLIRILVPSGKKLRKMFEFVASSATAQEKATKEAASFKVRRMMEHAIACHRCHRYSSADRRNLASGCFSYDARNRRHLMRLQIDGRTAHALYRYQEKLLDREPIGGISWTARAFLSGNKLTRQEGVWLHPRLLWCHLSQWFVCGFFVYYWVQLSKGGGVIGSYKFLQTSKSVQPAIAVGAVAALIACLLITIRQLPTAITTVLCFRHGVYGSLQDYRNFRPYRFAQDTGTALFGSVIWGLLATGAIFWSFFSLLTLGFISENTHDFFMSLLAQIIGVLTTFLLKLIVFQILRATWFGAFYRRRPAFANIWMVLSECWNLGLSSAYILSRTLKLLLLAALYIGRIDTPFLADGVGWLLGEIPIDGYPMSFRRDLLIHEAHRHPYMERWALLYLLKLRHGKKFGIPAGAAWRILFTLALMPWLRKHRVYPKVRESWSETAHSNYQHHTMNYEDMLEENQMLKCRVERLEEVVKQLSTTRRSVQFQSFRV